MELPLISIVMPAKNTAQFIDACIDSIKKQTYTKWELLVVDDGSEDDTYLKLKKQAVADNRIHVFKNRGKGIIDALQLAYKNSSGILITRMDADDLMTEHKLQLMQKSLQDSGKGHLATGLVKYFSDGSLGDGFKRYEEWLNSLSQLGNNFNEIYKECVIPSPCWMMHKSDFEKAGAFNSNRYPEDYDLAFRFMGAGLKCLPSNNILHHWRDYASRTSRTDPHYADSSFIDIKVNYFLKLAHQKDRNLVVWGAGKKGKRVAALLLESAIPFYWICDNPKKIGKDIYGQKMLSFKTLDDIENPQSIVTVANVLAQQEIITFFKQRNKIAMKDYFFFC